MAGSKLLDSIGVSGCIVVILVLIVTVVLHKRKKTAARIAFLRDKYRDESVVQGIMQRRFWTGQTSEQLRDALGNPVDVESKLLATRHREVWKHQHRGANRYGLRITLDDGAVRGWDQK